jgi:hypothetical protein
MTKGKVAVEGTGRDNRTPFVGGTQFPTINASSTAKRLDSMSKSRAEVGPAPHLNALDRTGNNTIQDASVKMISPVGSLPKIGADMSAELQNDPLVQYVQKHAQQLEANLDSMDLGGQDFELQSEPTDFRGTELSRRLKQEDELLKGLFNHYPSEK